MWVDPAVAGWVAADGRRTRSGEDQRNEDRASRDPRSASAHDVLACRIHLVPHRLANGECVLTKTLGYTGSDGTAGSVRVFAEKTLKRCAWCRAPAWT